MPLTQQQIQQLIAAQQRIAGGTGSTTDQQNLDYATANQGFTGGQSGGQPSSQPSSQPAPKTYLDFINDAYKAPQYLEAQKKYDDAMKILSDLQAQVPGYLDKKSSELQQSDPELQKLIKQRGEYTSQLYSKPFEARDEYKDIFDPTTREALVSKSVGNIMGQLSTTGDFIGQRRGTADQRAQRALEALQAQVGLAQTGVGLASDEKSRLESLLNTGAQSEYEKTLLDEQQKIDLSFNEASLMGGILDPEQEKLLKDKGLLGAWQGQSTAARKGTPYIPKSDEEWADIEKMLGLQKVYSNYGGGGGGEKGLTPLQIQAMRNDLKEDLDGDGLMAQAIINRQITREEAAVSLSSLYPELGGEMQNLIYAMFPDWSLSQEQAQDQSGGGGFDPIPKSPLNPYTHVYNWGKRFSGGEVEPNQSKPQ